MNKLEESREDLDKARGEQGHSYCYSYEVQGRF